MPQYIEYCLSTFKRSGVKVIILNPENVNDYIDIKFSQNWKKLSQIAQKTDCLRIPIIYKYGGMWADADTIFIKNCEHLFKSDDDFTGCQWTGNKKMLNTYFIAPPESKFIGNVLNKINNVLENNFKIYYEEDQGVYLGESIFEKARKQNKIKLIDVHTYVPVEFTLNKEIWYDNKDINDFIKSDSICIALNHSYFKQDFIQSNLESIYQRNDLLGSIFRYSKGVKI